ncbi:hypothetical protein AKJ53_00400 [candidate division MSBL1 archaeon SCGC-AAA382F02]|uniref:Putative nickel-responsive regulator n=1 Tax=candidate division MSBL1 archaeon SCGC-AAA382F02 TaxID=1698282 RepID=A0A133VJ13_9EURY|nr:hypothetical protein AKJ53_00400 [candidate division MSBL1 archaeon SCGC-AAA382F02]
MSDELNRVSLTIPQDLLEDLDKVLKDQDYSSRSEAVRDALRDFISEYRWRKKLKGKQRGVIVLVYNHDVRGLTDELLDIQHESRGLITSVQHLHVGEDECLEAMIVKGSGEKIRELVNNLKTLRGIKQVKLATVG